MFSENSLFLTYNQNVEIEQSTALRLQTLSHLYQMEVLLPARFGQVHSPSPETKRRIDASNFIVAFSLFSMQAELQAELNYAMQKDKKILVFYDAQGQRTIDFGSYRSVKEIFINFSEHHLALNQVAEFIKQEAELVKAKQAGFKEGLILGLIGAGLGLLSLWAANQKD